MGMDTALCLALHQQRLFSQLLRLNRMAHHKKLDCIHTKVLRNADVLARDVSLRTVGSDTYRCRAEAMGLTQIMFCCDTGEAERCDFGVFDRAGPLLQSI